MARFAHFSAFSRIVTTARIGRSKPQLVRPRRRLHHYNAFQVADRLRHIAIVGRHLRKGNECVHMTFCLQRLFPILAGVRMILHLRVVRAPKIVHVWI